MKELKHGNKWNAVGERLPYQVKPTKSILVPAKSLQGLQQCFLILCVRNIPTTERDTVLIIQEDNNLCLRD
jgi:hypothetical protein